MTARTLNEPLLNTVARKLGHAAGTVSKVTQELTESLAAAPKKVSAKMRDAVQTTATEKRPRERSVSRKKPSAGRRTKVENSAGKAKRPKGLGKARRGSGRKPAN